MAPLLALALAAATWTQAAGRAYELPLLQGTAARSSLGAAGGATLRGADALGADPAGIEVDEAQLAFSYRPLLSGSRLSQLQGVVPLRALPFTLGAGLVQLDSGAIEGRLADGRRAGSYANVDRTLTFAAAGRLPGEGWLPGARRLDVGAAVKLIQSQLADRSARGVAFDVGARCHLGQRPITLAVSLLDVGRGLRYVHETTPMPTALVAAAAYPVSAAASVIAGVRGGFGGEAAEAALGVVLRPFGPVELRGHYRMARAEGGALPSLAAGFGLRLPRSMSVDYNFHPLAAQFGRDGSASHELTLGYRFGNRRAQEPRSWSTATGETTVPRGARARPEGLRDNAFVIPGE